MKTIILLLLFSLYIQPAGFAGHTLILTKQGQTTFDTVDLNTLVSSDKKKTQPVLFFSKQTVANIVHITIVDETIICHKKQLFWCVNKNHWVFAKDLLPGDLLQTIDGLQIPIDEINIIERQTELYSLTVGPPHHLYIGKYNVLAHNLAWVIVASASPAVSAGVVEFIQASIFPVLSVIALKIYDCFAKNRNKKKPKMAIPVQPVCNAPLPDPNDDKKKYTYQHGIYEDADYHTTTQNGLKSPRPQDGQKALDNSYEVKGSDQRISIENDKFVILKRTSNQKYHGYVINWKELKMGGSKYQNLINTLIDNGLVKHSGKIIT